MVHENIVNFPMIRCSSAITLQELAMQSKLKTSINKSLLISSPKLYNPFIFERIETLSQKKVGFYEACSFTSCEETIDRVTHLANNMPWSRSKSHGVEAVFLDHIKQMS